MLNSIDLERSLLQAGYKNQTIVLEDNGFLPDFIHTPVGFFTEMHEGCKTSSKFFNELSLPNHWEIRGDG